MCSPAGSQAVDQVLGLCAQAAGPQIRVSADLGFQPRPLIAVCTLPGTLGLFTWAAGGLITVCAHPGFQVSAPSLLIWVCAHQNSGVCWGWLSGVQVRG